MRHLVTTITKHLLTTAVLFFTVSALAVPDSITMQMRIQKPNGTAMDATAVTFQYTTLDPLGTCVLYVETFAAVDMSTSSGLVVHNLGTGARVYSATTSSYTTTFDNTQTGFTCQAGGTYVPANTDRRRIIVQFNDATGAGWQTLQAININSVPYANFAGDSVRLANHPIADFALKSAFPDCNTAGKVLTYNGTAFTCISPSTGGGTVTNVTSANPYLSVATGTSTPALTVNVGTAANTLAAGNDTRITGALQKASNLSDLASAATARTNLGSTTTGDALFISASATAARTTLGLGTVAVLDVGTSANNVVQLDGAGKIPAAVLPAGLVTSSTTLVGDVTGTTGATVVSNVGAKTAAQVAQSVTETLAATNANTASTIVKRDASGNIAVTNVSATNVSAQNNYLYDGANTNKIILKAPTTGITDYTFTLPPMIGTANQIIGYNAAGTVLENKSITAGSGITVTQSAGGIQISSGAGAGTVTSVTSANADIAVGTGTSTPVLTLNSGTGASQIVKLDSSAKLPAVDGSALTNLAAANLSGAVPITKGGTGATTAAAALTNLLPTQTSNGGKFLQTDGTSATWQAANAGTVTSVTSANAYITVATGTSTPAITAVVGTAASTLAAGNDSRIVNAIQQSAYSGDVASVLDSNCGAGSAPKWNVATDMWSCVAIGSLDAAAITTGTIAAARLPSTATFSGNIAAGSFKIGPTDGTINASAPMFAGSTPLLEISTGDAMAQEAIVFRKHNSDSSATLRRLGILMKMTNETNTGESSKSGGLVLESSTAWSGSPSLSLTVADNKVLTATPAGYVGIGTATPAAPLEITSATANTSGLRFTSLTSASPAAANTNRVLSVSSTGDVQLNSPALPFYSINATTSSTTVNRDYNTVAALGTNVAISDVLGPMSNGPGNLGWFTAVYTAANSSTNPYTSQFALSDLGAAFRGGQTPSINSAVWQKFLTLPASSGFSVSASGSDATLLNANNGFLALTTNNTERMRIIAGGNIGIRATAPTAYLNIAAGTATAGTAPLKLTAGTNLTTAESGAIEFDGTNLYYTDSTPARRTIATTSASTYTGVSSISNSGGNISLAPNSTTGTVQVTSSTASTGAASGALVVNGGVGVGGDIYATSSINAGTTITALTSILTPQLYGSASASGNIKIDGTSNATKGFVLLNSTGGNVGVGTSAPVVALDVQGQIRSRVFDNTSLTTIDWNKGNIQYTTDSCQAYAFTNVMDGGSYTFTVKGATSAQCTFSQSGLTFHYTPSNGVTNASTHTIYTLFRAGSDVYVSWVTGL